VNEYLKDDTLTKHDVAHLLEFIIPALINKMGLMEWEEERELNSLTSFIQKWQHRSSGWTFWFSSEIR
jgi:hypothetical protein